jgi:hypothetical protein
MTDVARFHIHEGCLYKAGRLLQTVKPRLQVSGAVIIQILGHDITLSNKALPNSATNSSLAYSAEPKPLSGLKRLNISAVPVDGSFHERRAVKRLAILELRLFRQRNLILGNREVSVVLCTKFDGANPLILGNMASMPGT